MTSPTPPSPRSPGSEPQVIGEPPSTAPQVVYVEKKRGSALKWLAIIGIVLLVLLGGCMALLASAADSIGEELEQQQDQRESDEQLVQDNAQITSCDNGDFGGKVTVEFTNPLPEEKGYISVEINFFDASDVVIGDAIVTFENLEPGQMARGEGTAFNLPDDSVVARCEVVDGTIL